MSEQTEVVFEDEAPAPPEETPEPTENPRKVTHVLYVLDESGSMERLASTVVKEFNNHLRQIKRQAKQGGDTRVGLVTFSDQSRVQMWDQPADDARPLTTSQYQPRGSTAMLDAVGRTLDGAKLLTGYGWENVAFLCVIISDGYENSSKKETYESVRLKIEACNETGRWDFAYIGSNQNLAAVRDQTGINGSVTYAATAPGTQAVLSASASALQGFFRARGAGGMSVSGSYAQETQTIYDATIQQAQEAQVPDVPLPDKKAPPKR